MTQRFLTLKEAAERLRLKPRTLYNRRWRGEGPKSVREGNRVLYRVSDIEAYERSLPFRRAS
jgi:predicted DNA-binding transcriptional regulator AlpA